ncbi:UDP-N-acetylmuramoyl-L-alanine--D-glutamate ligase [Spiractinospora alimapuensis]|uniref:UDP-N-acetylmuramoyl-L-alanine--D-glutamate ligase n=1 Tax=Spiractinospora alimapuensis TaxID=2820884 RepID=UPI001EEC652C|nr:UDP-N-acetylmuramoyl-L-alanine--D-glutamate ligase [Spiractinospora alimapuensis]QVQ53133.1 UDP-N-acetylmuramoyl-L-alanine--D-glutamate ligase [Spiractinospora alimapuensis]
MTPDGAPPPRPSAPWSDADLTGLAVCVAGLGVSGPPAARALARRGARVCVIDGQRESDAADADPVAARVHTQAAELRGHGIEVRTGTDALPAGTELVVTSPGWRPDAPALVAANRAGIEVIGDVELAWRLKPAGQRWLAVTATNGKTTTVRMLEAILRAAGYQARAVGNVGTSIVDVALEPGAENEILAVELSSFQLHWSTGVRPEAATVLNVAADHVDWHGDLESYAADKGRIYASGTTRIVNLDDPWSRRLADRYGDPTTPTIGFTLAAPAIGELGVADGTLVDRTGATRDEPGVVLASVDDVRPAAPHNVANALAAAAMARVAGVPAAAVRAGLVAFTPEDHRIATVGTIDGVEYVNDSKATNAHAAAASLAAYDSVVWIAGGLLKGAQEADLDALVRAARERLRGVVLIGADRARLRAALERTAPDVPVVEIDRTDVNAMDAVIGAARDLATTHAASTVLLAPAAASMDMFTNYGERGDVFAAAVTRGIDTAATRD